jgi:hypothetical protein
MLQPVFCDAVAMVATFASSNDEYGTLLLCGMVAWRYVWASTHLPGLRQLCFRRELCSKQRGRVCVSAPFFCHTVLIAARVRETKTTKKKRERYTI